MILVSVADTETRFRLYTTLWAYTIFSRFRYISLLLLSSSGPPPCALPPLHSRPTSLGFCLGLLCCLPLDPNYFLQFSLHLFAFTFQVRTPSLCAASSLLSAYRMGTPIRMSAIVLFNQQRIRDRQKRDQLAEAFRKADKVSISHKKKLIAQLKQIHCKPLYARTGKKQGFLF